MHSPAEDWVRARATGRARGGIATIEDAAASVLGQSGTLPLGLSTKMKLFGGQGSGPASRNARPGANGNGHELPAHRLTLNLTNAENFANMLAKSRMSRTVEVADLLAGMYICDWERLSTYWEDDRQDEIEEFLQRICQMSPQRWHSWIECYDTEKRKEERLSRTWPPLRKLLKRIPPSEGPLQFSDALATVLKQAEQITPFYDRTPGKSIPILTSECVLLCIARTYGTEITKKLAETGLDATKLERDVFSSRRAPRA